MVASLLIACRQPESGDPTTTDTDPPVTESETAEDTADTDPPVVGPVTEVFSYDPPPVDVLFVIDSSTSMTGNVAEMTGAVGPLVNLWLARSIDFHAGVVDIDDVAGQGRLLEVANQRWASSDQATPGALLQGLVEAVGDPSTVEAGLSASYRALQLTDAGEPNAGFLRDGSDLSVVVMTDEEDQSDPGLITPAGYVEFLQGLRPDSALVSFNALAATEDYLEVASATNGVAWHVTNTPYGPALEAITALIEGDNRFVLSADADEDSLTAHIVEPDGGDVDLEADDLDYDEDTREVDLEGYFPMAGASVEIRYLPLSE